jgi:hypothetical protein
MNLAGLADVQVINWNDFAPQSVDHRVLNMRSDRRPRALLQRRSGAVAKLVLTLRAREAPP